ncbi:MAG: peptidoglycan DD-metalloendopeptidase family protein [Alphaproteobacteria bacterium]|nr:peptidoglycan DD-metalloendopeptidase family protein [Alphaproteobacteria bacterium]
MERSNDPRGRRPNRKRKEQTAQSLIAALLLGTASGCATVDMQAPVYNARLARPATVVLVQQGDTVPSLARRYNVPAEAIIETNGLYAPYRLTYGQRIVIPPAYVAAAWQPQTTAQPKPRPRKLAVEAVEQTDLPPLPKPREAPRVAPVKRAALTSPVVVESGETTPDPRLEGARFYALGTPRAKPAFEGQGGPEELTAPKLADAGVFMPRPKPKRDIAQPDLDAPYEPPKKVKLRDPDLAYDEKPKAKSVEVAERDPDAAFDERPAAKSTGRFLWPVQGKVVSNFGRRGTGVHNDGINIAADPNTPVKAADTGTVVYAGNDIDAYGNLLLVRHANGYVTAYAHNKKLLVGRGDTVSRGDTIALVGSTGDVDRPQLHFEIRKGDRAVDPNRYLIRETASR